MRHLAEGTLRRMLDEPLAARDAERQHYRGCPTCQERARRVAEDARVAMQALSGTTPSIDNVAALARLHHRIECEGNPQPREHGGIQTLAWRLRLRRRPVGIVAAVAVAAAVAWTPAGSLAQQFVTVFQPGQVTEVQVTFTDLQSLAELSRYGTFHLPKKLGIKKASNAAAAGQKAGMHVLTPPSLPTGVSNDARYKVVPGETASFTFSATKAQAVARAEGKTIPPMPANIDGSTLRVVTQPGVVAVYGAGQTIPALVIGQTKAPTVTSSGVSATELENYVLSLPGISAQLAAQIRSIGDITKTLPVPVVVDREQAQQVTVQGVSGLAVGDQTGVGSGVLWEKDGIIYGVAAPMPEDQVIALANSLR